MCIVRLLKWSGPTRWIVVLFVCALGLFSHHAGAHPVAQGAMEITVAEQALTVRVSVTLEEVLVASAYGPENARDLSPTEAARRHGPYLLGHLHVKADGVRIQGRLVSPEPLTERLNHFAYQFEFPLPKALSVLALEQNVLNEFDFAPGNRWEASYVVRIVEADGNSREGLLLTSREPLVIRQQGDAGPAGARVQRWHVFNDYVRHGMLHILTGYDHLLFVTALVLAVRTFWELVKVITAFTVAHSLTLGLSALDLVRLPSSVVEPVIAASIVVIALQNVFWFDRAQGGSRLLVAFVFGLFHGLGFAGGLLEAMHGMGSEVFLLALLAFSVGVELGHQVVVLPLFGLLKLAKVCGAGCGQPKGGDSAGGPLGFGRHLCGRMRLFGGGSWLALRPPAPSSILTACASRPQTAVTFARGRRRGV